MSRSAEVTLAFAGEDRAFRLPIGRLRALQEKTDCGPMELLNRFAGSSWRVDDLRETIRQGLLGGEMPDVDVTRLLKTGFDDLPLGQFIPLAQAIILAVIVGPPDDSVGEPEGEAPTSPSPVESFASPVSTDQEPSSASRPETSTT